jgi:membrane protein required for colicin V production
MAEITWLDALVGVVIVASAVYAAWKGLLRETMSIFAWALAAYAALVFGPMLRAPLHELFSPKWLGDVIAYAGVFLIVLVPLSFLSFRFSESIQKSPVGPVDRTLGFVFGIGRGLVLVALPYIAFTMLVPIKEQPSWIKSAATLPLIQKTSDVLLSLVPNQSRHGEPAVAEKPAPKPGRSQRSTGQETRQKTYGARERHQLDRLIQTTGGDGPQSQ